MSIANHATDHPIAAYLRISIPSLVTPIYAVSNRPNGGYAVRLGWHHNDARYGADTQQIRSDAFRVARQILAEFENDPESADDVTVQVFPNDPLNRAIGWTVAVEIAKGS